MTLRRSLLPLVVVAGAGLAPPALAAEPDPADAAVAPGACPVVPDRTVTVVPALRELPAAGADRESAALTFTASDPAVGLRVTFRQDGRRGRRGAVRVVAGPGGEQRVTVRRPAGGGVRFATERVRHAGGTLGLRLRAVVTDADGDVVRTHRLTVHVRALREVCPPEPQAPGDEAERPAPGDEDGAAAEPGAPGPDAPASDRVTAEPDEAEREDEDEAGDRGGRGRGRDRDRDRDED